LKSNQGRGFITLQNNVSEAEALIRYGSTIIEPIALDENGETAACNDLQLTDKMKLLCAALLPETSGA